MTPTVFAITGATSFVIRPSPCNRLPSPPSAPPTSFPNPSDAPDISFANPVAAPDNT